MRRNPPGVLIINAVLPGNAWWIIPEGHFLGAQKANSSYSLVLAKAKTNADVGLRDTAANQTYEAIACSLDETPQWHDVQEAQTPKALAVLMGRALSRAQGHAGSTFHCITSSMVGAQWNPGWFMLPCIVPDYATLHPGYFTDTPKTVSGAIRHLKIVLA